MADDPRHYCTLEELKEALGEQTGIRDDLYELAIAAASEQIDEFRGHHFWLEDTPTQRLFVPDNPGMLWTGDFADTQGLAVATDADDDGEFETEWQPGDWQPEPLQRLNGRPYTRLIAVGDHEFPLSWGRATVRVTARWGWVQVPKPVRQACRILAVDHFKSKDLTGGVAGFSDFGPVRISAFNPQAKALLQPYKLP